MAVPSPAFLCTQALTEASTPAPGLMGQASIRTLAGAGSGQFALSLLAGKSSNVTVSSPMWPDNEYAHLGFTGGSSGTHSFQADVLASGGTAPYTYAWSRTPTANTSFTGSTTSTLVTMNVNYPAGGLVYSGTLTCVVNDSSGKTATLNITVNVEMQN